MHPNIWLTEIGENNRVNIEQPLAAHHVTISLYGDTSVTIGANCILGNLMIYAAAGSKVVIGAGVGFNGVVRLLLHEPKSIQIGDGCLFGAEVDVTVSDMHSILDAETGARINPAHDIVICDRVWIGQRATILKGAKIGHNSVIGASSVVTGIIPSNCVAAGNPARVIRLGTKWMRELI